MKINNLIFRVTMTILFCLSVFWFDRNDVFGDQFGAATSTFHLATIARLVVVAFLLITIVSLGTLFLNRIGGVALLGVDNFLATIVLGGGVVATIVFFLGIFGILYNWLVMLLLLAFVPYWPHFDLKYQMFSKQLSELLGATPGEKRLNALLLLGLVLLTAYLLLWKGLVAPSAYGDIVSHYIPYYNSVAEQHSTANIKEFYWHFYEFKGSSFHFLNTVLADVHAIQLFVFTLLLIASVALFKTVQRIGGSTGIGLLAIGIFLGSTEVLYADLQKAHVTIAVFIILAFYFGQMLFEANEKNLRPLTWVFCVALGMISILQTLSSAFALLLLGALGGTALCFHQHRLLLLFFAALCIPITISLLTMLYNYSMTGMYEIYPITFFMEHGDRARYLQQFSLVDMAYLIDIQPNNPGNTSELINSYKTGGVGSVITFLAGAYHSFIILACAGVSVVHVMAMERYNDTDLIGGKLLLIGAISIALIVVFSLDNVSLRYFSEMVLFPRSLDYRIGLAIVLILVLILILQPLNTEQAKPALVAGVLFAIGAGASLIIAGGQNPGTQAIERMTVFRPFFQALFIAALLTFLLQLIVQYFRVSSVYVAVIVPFIFLHPVNVVQTTVQLKDWHSSLLMPYVRGEVSYSEIYGNFHGGWADYMRRHIPKESRVVSLNYCRACESIPGIDWELPLWNVYSEKTGEVWYGNPDIAAKVLKDHQVDLIAINLSEPLLLFAYAPLFRPDQIGKYFNVLWTSSDSSPNGKNYLLAWRDESSSDNSLLQNFLKDYGAKVSNDMKTGRGIHEYIGTFAAGQKRFGAQWTWDPSWKTE